MLLLTLDTAFVPSVLHSIRLNDSSDVLVTFGQCLLSFLLKVLLKILPSQSVYESVTIVHSLSSQRIGNYVEE